jgi:hypothetical protein
MAGGGALQLLNGRITADGNIQCFCSRCQGHQKVPNSVFEEHAGSKVGAAWARRQQAAGSLSLSTAEVGTG